MDENPPPSMNKQFIKNFSNEGKLSTLPDSDYWLSREEMILTNLYLRGGAVPKVQIKNLIDKSLTLQNAGTSLDEYLTNPAFPKISSALGFQAFLSSTIKLQDLFNLGILHLDVALRNIASPDLLKNELYILDFIHALSEHNQLQKPLPLVPTPDLHHPLLIEALERDWRNYFSSLGKPCPKLDKTLTISNQEFCEYWVNTTQVQLLYNNLALLSHGLGNLATEFAHSPNLEVSCKTLFQDLGLKMRNQDEGDATQTLEYAKNAIEEAMSNLGSNPFYLNNATPIPTVQKANLSGEGNEESLSYRDKSHKLSNPGEQTLTSQTARPKTSMQRSKRWGSLLVFTLCWSLIGLNIYLIDAIVIYKKIILSDEIILWIIIAGALIPLGLCFSIFQQDKRKNNSQRIFLVLAVFTQFAVITSFPTSTYNQIWTWIPPLMIGLSALLLNFIGSMHRKTAPT
jgi:hypothetical protein